ncbi:E3 ubiquitin/ISG15 ligase TRIM25-like [Discoglossus pictus]
MASADLREELDCAICLNIYTDPVMLSCGHNFCQVCIGSVLDTQEGSGVYTCPECREQFNDRPALHRNLKLWNIAQHFIPTQPEQEDAGIFCTYCIHTQVPAAKSCLMCEASLCDDHVRVHSKSEEHVLSEPTTSWVNRKCSVHKEFLKYYCSEDATCICVSCCLVGEHKGHKVESLNEASEKKKNELMIVLEKLILKKERVQKKIQNLQEHRREVQEKAAGATERVTALFWDISELLGVLENQILSEIARQENEVLPEVCDLISKLENEQYELSRKMRRIEELRHMDDPLTVLQELGSHDAAVCDTEDGDEEDLLGDDKDVPAGGDLDEDLISVTLHRGLADIVTDVKIKRGFYVKEASDILLNANTAGPNVALLDNLKTALWSLNRMELPANPKRFICYSQVLSVWSFSSGRHYWEVETSESGNWSVGMCYPSINRSGTEDFLGYSNKSWCLQMCNENVSVVHNSRNVPQKCSCQKFGIFLDYESGRLSFYELCDPIRHLHTFTATFTEPLHAAFWVNKSWVRIQS